ncbi:MAG TPA: hypothetical protein V6D08_00735 [Candidatus Obscuribacterales bacterium]
MKRHLTFVAWIVGVFLLATGALTATFWSKRTIWPEFPAAADSAPQVVVQFEPDFAWRIGDRVPVHIYIKQQPNTELDLNSLAVEGDFEIAGQPDFYVRDRKDGSRYVHVTLELQSFEVGEKLSFKATMSYTVAGSKEPRAASIPEQVFYTSRTWDGRPDIKDGPLPVLHGWHYWTTAAALLAGLAGIVLGLWYLRRLKNAATQPEQIPLSRWEAARLEFEAVWARMAEGDDRPERYKDIERIIRRLYRIESRTVREIPYELGGNHPHLAGILTILGSCEKVLFARRKLTDDERQAIRTTFDTMIPARKKAPPAKRS